MSSLAYVPHTAWDTHENVICHLILSGHPFFPPKSGNLTLGKQRNYVLLLVASILIYQNKLALILSRDYVAFLPQ